MNVLMIAVTILSLNGLWDFRLERARPMEELAALPAFEADDKMVVPGAWDTTSRYYNQRGTGCYRRKFTVNGTMLAPKLVVDGMGLRARFWLDGRDLGLVKLPWSKVELDLGAGLELGEHELVAVVDSMVDAKRTKLFSNSYDFYPFGGFHHGVWIEFTTQQVDYRRVIVRTRDYKTGLVELQLEPWQDRKFSDFFLNGELTVVFDNRGYRPFGSFVDPKGAKPMTVKFTDGKALVKVPNFKLWSPDEPNLHTVYVTGPDSQLATPAAEARFGIR